MLGDTHNFGRRVAAGAAGTIKKPRTVLWEWLLLSAKSPLRRLLGEIAPDAFAFLPDLDFSDHEARESVVQKLELEPLSDAVDKRELAAIVGRSLALYSWLGLADLHWENLALGSDARGRIVLAPLDVEMILADLALPTETKLLPAADPDYAALLRHACGVRRVLPYLGKPIAAEELLAIAGAYRATLALVDHHAGAIADVFAKLPTLRDAPIRVCLRATGDYVQAKGLWPPLLGAEREQMDRGDIPYFFRLYGWPGIHYYGDASLETIKTLPLTGDMPKLEKLLDISRALRSPSRRSLREQGLFAIFGAFDHPSLSGTHAHGDLEVTLRARTIVSKAGKDELETRRDMSAFVGSVYLPCRCGEVRTVFVPPVTKCDARVQGSKRRGSPRRVR